MFNKEIVFMFLDGEPSSQGEPSPEPAGSTGSAGGQEPSKEPVSAPEFVYEDRGQKPGTPYGGDFEIKRTNR